MTRAMARSCSQLASTSNHNRSHGAVPTITWAVLNLGHDVHALQDLSKDHVGTIQPWAWHSGDKELAAKGRGSNN
eukprot:scaffold4290_cov14-Tisochrysis_lutea.AAC.1